MADEPVWKRVLGGLCGIGILIALLAVARDRGATSSDVQEVETAVVIAAAGAGIAYWFARRKQRRQP